MKRFVAAFIVAILGFDVMAGGKIIMLKDKIKELPAEDQKIINSIKIKKLEPAIGRYTYNSITLYASSKNIISDKISAEIYYLCQDGNKKYSVLKITAGLDFVMKGKGCFSMGGMGSRESMRGKNGGKDEPVDIFIRLLYDGKPFCEIFWKRNKKAPKDWWENKDLIYEKKTIDKFINRKK